MSSVPLSNPPPGEGPAHPIPSITGWRVIVSDEGRFWASRVEPFTSDQTRGGAFRTVDADDVDALRAQVAEQERLAEAPR